HRRQRTKELSLGARFRAVPCHERSEPLPQFYNAFMFEFAISFGDGVDIDNQITGNFPNAGKLLVRPKSASLDRMLHLIDKLKVDRNSRTRIGLPEHLSAVIVHYYREAVKISFPKRPGSPWLVVRQNETIRRFNESTQY